MFGEDDIVKSHKLRADLIGHIMVICFLGIVARLWFLQVFHGERFLEYSTKNRLRKEIQKAPRGMIYSRNNQVMVYNTPRFDAVITPQFLKNKKETIKKLSVILEMTEKQIAKRLKKYLGQPKYVPVIIKKNLSNRELAIIETENNKLPGVTVNTFISREYSDKEIGSHLVGYISEISQSQLPKYKKRDRFNYKLGDFIGQSGIEQKYDLKLRGEDGHVFVEVDARGRMKRYIGNESLFGGTINNKQSKPGNNIKLTIDRDMQIAAYKALEGKVGSAVAVDVHTGEILTMVSRPSFDPSQFSRGLSSEYWNSLVQNENNPMWDRTVQEHYAPGSTFKTITAIAALEEGVITSDKELSCGPSFRLGKRNYHDWKRGGHGMTDVYKSLRRSVDVYYYKLATLMDIDTISEYAKRLGFGKKTGIELSRERPGLIPTKEWKKKRFGIPWQKGETLSCAIGQSFVLATPLQLALAYAAIANGGKVYKPILLKEIFTNEGEVIQKADTELISNANISDKTLKTIRKALSQVAYDPKGTAWWYKGFGTRMAGKTGTAQVRSMNKKELFSKCEEMPMKSRHHGVFVGFAPSHDPKIAVASVVEHGCHGSSAAVPVVRDVMIAYMKKYYPQDFKRYEKEDRAFYKKWIAARYKKKEEVKTNAEAGQTSTENKETE